MFCPSCRDEFRPGFTHCASCDVDLVESLDAAGAMPDLPSPGAASAPATRSRGSIPAVIPDQPPVAFCGFLTLEEAADARAKLRGEGVRSEILIREDELTTGAAPKDTYWLRLSPAAFKKATAVLGYDEAEVEDAEEAEGDGDGIVQCSACGEDVRAEETSCPHCGARFEEG